MWTAGNRTAILTFTLLALLAIHACLPQSPSEGGNAVNITLYGFSIMKESFEKEIYPAFAAKVKREHGLDVLFFTYLAGSETFTIHILEGLQSRSAPLSLEAS